MATLNAFQVIFNVIENTYIIDKHTNMIDYLKSTASSEVIIAASSIYMKFYRRGIRTIRFHTTNKCLQFLSDLLPLLDREYFVYNIEFDDKKENDDIIVSILKHVKYIVNKNFSNRIEDLIKANNIELTESPFTVEEDCIRYMRYRCDYYFWPIKGKQFTLDPYTLESNSNTNQDEYTRHKISHVDFKVDGATHLDEIKDWELLQGIAVLNLGQYINDKRIFRSENLITLNAFILEWKHNLIEKFLFPNLQNLIIKQSSELVKVSNYFTIVHQFPKLKYFKAIEYERSKKSRFWIKDIFEVDLNYFVDKVCEIVDLDDLVRMMKNGCKNGALRIEFSKTNLLFDLVEQLVRINETKLVDSILYIIQDIIYDLSSSPHIHHLDMLYIPELSYLSQFPSILSIRHLIIDDCNQDDFYLFKKIRISFITINLYCDPHKMFHKYLSENKGGFPHLIGLNMETTLYISPTLKSLIKMLKALPKFLSFLVDVRKRKSTQRSLENLDLLGISQFKI